ncbi:hypothetical protein HC174_07535 [Salinimicrobium sp. CDJ15-81-2]|nr:hypothetical protein [Salinimicrobium nanhaiense]
MKLKLLMMVLFSTVSTFAQQTFSEEEILQKIDSINATPFSEDTKEITAQTLFWIQKESGIEVMDLELFVNALKSSNKELAQYLIRSYFFGKVEHILKNDVSHDNVEAKVAGMEELTGIYEKFISTRPEAANPEADKLAAFTEEDLREYIKSFDNRNGLSFETAVVPRSIIAEYEWMKENYPNAELLGKSLIKHQGRTYDVFELQKKGEEKIKIYFDTSIIL